LAAMEGQFKTQAYAPLRIGGIPDEAHHTVRFALEIPGGLSWLAYGSAAHIVKGLDDFPQDAVPPVAIVHLAFQTMVGVGTWLVVLGTISLGALLKPAIARHRFFWLALAVSGPLSVVG